MSFKHPLKHVYFRILFCYFVVRIRKTQHLTATKSGFSVYFRGAAAAVVLVHIC